jgi:hypothetical protein
MARATTNRVVAADVRCHDPIVAARTQDLLTRSE